MGFMPQNTNCHPPSATPGRRCLRNVSAFEARHQNVRNKMPKCLKKRAEKLDIAFFGQYLCTCHPEDIFPVIQRSFATKDDNYSN